MTFIGRTRRVSVFRHPINYYTFVSAVFKLAVVAFLIYTPHVSGHSAMASRQQRSTERKGSGRGGAIGGRGLRHDTVMLA